MCEDMISRRERLKNSHGCPGSGSKGGRAGTAFKRADSLLEGLAIWIVVARIHEPARIGAFDVPLESGREMDRSRNGAGGGIDCVAGVDSQSFYAHRIVDLSTRRGIDSSHFLFRARVFSI